MLAWRGLRAAVELDSYSLSSWRRPCLCQHGPETPSYLQLRGGHGLVQFQELCFCKPSRLESLQQDSGPDFGDKLLSI